MHEINERNPLLSSKRKYSHQIASTPSLPPGPVNCSLTARQTNTSSTLASGPEHWCISQHIWYDEESHMTTPDINLVQMGHAAISRRDGNILKLNVHVILGFKQLSPIYLAGGDF